MLYNYFSGLKSSPLKAVLKTDVVKSPFWRKYLIHVLLLPRMKKIIFALIPLLAACGGSDSAQDIAHFYAPAAGTVVAADSIPITEDNLNDFYYSVRLTATDSSAQGRYDLDAAYGLNEAHSIMAFPKLTKTIRPAIRLDTSMPYSYIIGFYYEGEQQFNDYARVSARKVDMLQSQIELRYLKAYYTDTVDKK